MLVADHTHSPIFASLAGWSLRLVVDCTFLCIILIWRSSQLFLDLQMRIAKRRMQAWLPYLPALLQPGECVQDYGIAPSFWCKRLLIASNRRLLLLGLPAADGKPLWQGSWDAIHAPRVLSKPWWYRCMAPSGAILAIAGDGLQKPLRLHAFSRRHIEHLQAMFYAARERFMAHAPGPIEKTSARTSPAAEAIPPSPWRSALLSLLLPGLGQLEQHRSGHGTALMLLALGILALGSTSWIAWMGRFADQHKFIPITLAALYVALCIYSVGDAVRFARKSATDQHPQIH